MSVYSAGVARHVRELVERQRLDALADADLLARYRADRDDAAFAALVRRHGPMVLGTCRRVLARTHDAEDACQATFLVLARKAGSVRGGQALAGWLHRVAVRASCRLRRDLARRPTEPLPPDVVNPAPAAGGLEWREVRGAFDTEVGRLPDRFRLPLVLCYLQGKTRAEAAAELGWSEGAVRGRLERGRKLLQSRFVRRGITLPAAFLTLLSEDVGIAVADGPPTSMATRLADAVVRSMAAAKVKAVGWASAAVLLLGSAIGIGVSHQAEASQQPGTEPPAKVDPPAAADAQKNLGTFTLRIRLGPAGEHKFVPGFDLYSVFLYVPNLRLEPPANGPTGKPLEAHARITAEQAKKITAALKEHGFYDDLILGAPVQRMPDKTKPHAAVTTRYQNGEDLATREKVYPWAAPMLKPLDAVRACVDGDAATALDRLLGQLDEDRKKWDPKAADLRALQGTWVTDFGRAGGVAVPPEYATCRIDGTTIVFKPRIQADPRLDLETIRGQFSFETADERKPVRGLAVRGVRDTLTKTEPGEWFIPYDLANDTLTLLFRAPPAKEDRTFVLRWLPEKIQSPWGEPADGLRLRVTRPNPALGIGEGIELAIDVKAAAGGRHWVAGRDAQLARVEVNGVWYAPQHNVDYYIPPFDLAAGSEVSRWAVVRLNSGWVTEESRGKNPPRALDLKPGKYTVRVKYTFWSAADKKVSATPISGPLQIDVAAPPKEPAANAEWGEPSEGVRLRARDSSSRVAADYPVIDLDVKADAAGPGVWLARRQPESARVEVDGTWYSAELDLREIVNHELKAGEEIERWVSVPLSGRFVSRVGQAARSLELKPGKHTIRLGYSFTTDRPAGKVANPVSNAVEIEILPPTVTVTGWRRAWTVKAGHDLRARQQNDFLFRDGMVLETATDRESRAWDVSGPPPEKATTYPLSFRGQLVGFLDGDEPAFAEVAPRTTVSGQVFDVVLRRIRSKTRGAADLKVATLDEEPRSLALSPDGTQLATMAYRWDEVRMFDVKTREERRPRSPAVANRTNMILPHALVYSPDSKTLIGIGANDYPVLRRSNGAVVAWDIATGAVKWEAVEGSPLRAWAFSADGRRFATGDMAMGGVQVRDAESGDVLLRQDAVAAATVALSPDGETLVIGQHGSGGPPKSLLTIRSVDGRGTPVEIATPALVRRIAFRPDGKAFVTADQNGDIALWVRNK